MLIDCVSGMTWRSYLRSCLSLEFMFVESLFLILYEQIVSSERPVLGCLVADWIHFGWLDVV